MPISMTRSFSEVQARRFNIHHRTGRDVSAVLGDPLGSHKGRDIELSVKPSDRDRLAVFGEAFP